MASRIEQILQLARSRRVFSGAAWSHGTANGVQGSGTIGTLAWGGPPVELDTWWDLASVTKPIVGLAVMSLLESGDLLLDDTIADHLPDYAATDKAVVTVRQLLTHTSGMPGQVPLYHWCSDREHMLEAIRNLPLQFEPGTDVTYSSQGFVILGLIAEAASGLPLEQLVEERVTRPAGMMRTSFGLPADLRDHAAATEDCAWRGRIVQGTVHDENAEVLGGTAGHAGLFAPLADLEALGRVLCADGRGPRGIVVSSAALATMTSPATEGLRLRRCLAWQGRDRYHSPAGDLVGARAYGHTGFTGTSLWIEPDLGRYVVLLTNRVHPSRAGQAIARVRRLVHNSAMGYKSGTPAGTG